MKKLIYFFCSIMFAITSCEPLEDVYEQLDAAPAAKKTLSIALTNANYESLGGKPGVPSYVNTGKFFISEKQAGEFIPIILNANYPHLNDRDAIDVTYTTAAPSVVTTRTTHVLADEDYALGGTNFKNFDSDTQLQTYLNAKYPGTAEGRLATITYTNYNANINPTNRTVTQSFYYGNGTWNKTYTVSEAQYASVDRSRNNAFAVGDEVSLIPAAANKFLKESMVGAKVGDLQYVSYLVRYSSSNTAQEVLPLYFDGNNWMKTRPATLAFVKKQGAWVADPILRYSLVGDDYVWIGDQESIANKAKRDNLKQFKNFYQRFTDNPNYWTQDEVIAALSALINYKFPDAPEGQKYEVTYVVHTGPTGPKTIVLQKIDGKFVIPQD